MSSTRPARVASWLRLEPAVRLLPVSLVLGYLVAVAYEPQATAYPLTIAIRPHEAIIVLAPLGAASAAWMAGRWRRAAWCRRPWPRVITVPAVRSILSTAAVQLLAYEVIVIWVTVASDRTVPIEPRVLGIAAATLIGWTAVGYAAGWWVQAELALPIVVIGSYLALVYPPAMEPLWLRHLTGTLGQCCFPDATLDPDVVRAMVLLPIAGAIASLYLVRAARQPAFVLAAIATVVIAGAATVSMVDDLGADPIAPRSGRVVCAGTPEVCVWPEQAAELSGIVTEVERAASNWSALGLAVPRRFSVRPSDVGTDGTVGLGVWEDATRAEVVSVMAHGVLPEAPCDGAELGDIYESRRAAGAWLAIAGGVAPEAVGDRVDPAAFALAQRLDRLDDARRDRWLAAVERADPCSGAAIPVP